MAAHDATQRDVHATTTSSGWSTKRIATTALFCAVAAICTLFIEFPLIPGLTFLHYDPSGIVALVAGLAYGPATGVVVSVLPNLVHLATSGGAYGTLMAIIATLSMVLPTSLVYRRWHSFRGAVAGLVLGGVVCLACCIGANLVVTPLYMATTFETVVAMIVPALLPFNVLKIGINCVMTMLVYKPLSRALES